MCCVFHSLMSLQGIVYLRARELHFPKICMHVGRHTIAIISCQTFSLEALRLDMHRCCYEDKAIDKAGDDSV